MTSMGKGIFEGVTGLVTQPMKGAKEEGAKGFFKGFGKGIIGIATKPVAGVLDMASKTTEGITRQASSLRGVKAAAPIRWEQSRWVHSCVWVKCVVARSARGFFLNGTVLPLHGDYWAMQQVNLHHPLMPLRYLCCWLPLLLTWIWLFLSDFAAMPAQRLVERGYHLVVQVSPSQFRLVVLSHSFPGLFLVLSLLL